MVDISWLGDFLFQGPVDLTFQPGMTTGLECVSVSIIDDTILETSEDFQIRLSTDPLDSRVMVDNSITTVVILDDDGMPVLIC